ncbi:TlpA disulfide reductase family protein [Chitinophaga defluvii]|uniref:TlpA disulfide reductase family protein n=1 Tax=Chitinophaga defluvii TaxID=3163343 RepID=A0ABV2TCP7_9BACT
MKYLFLWMISICLSANLWAQQVSGTIKGASGKTLYLFDDEDNLPDDSVVIKNDQFSFTLKNDKSPAVYALILQDVNYPMLFVSGKEPITFTTAVASFPMAEAVKGNEDTKAMQAYQKAFDPLIKQAIALNAEAAGIQGDDEAAKGAFRKKADTFSDAVVKTGKDFIKQHPGNIASLWLLINELRTRVDPAEFEQLLGSMDKSMQQGKYGKMAGEYLKSTRANALGIAAGDFVQEDVNGKLVKLSSFRGKYVLVDFWASWCGPCRQENPNVVQAYNKFKDKNFTILGVSLDEDKSRWLRAIDQDKLSWTHVSDLRGWGNEVAQQYGVQSIPANFLVDPKGNIVARNLRGKALEEKLAQLLK